MDGVKPYLRLVAELETLLPIDKLLNKQLGCLNEVSKQTLSNNEINIVSSAVYVAICQTGRPCYWLDLKRRSDESRIFTWSDGSNFNGFHNIIKLDSNFYTSNDSCVCVYAVGRWSAFARTVNCSALNKFICWKKGTSLILIQCCNTMTKYCMSPTFPITVLSRNKISIAQAQLLCYNKGCGSESGGSG